VGPVTGKVVLVGRELESKWEERGDGGKVSDGGQGAKMF